MPEKHSVALITLVLDSVPKGPTRTKSSTESEFSTGSKFGTAVAQRYGECSEMLVFLGKGGRKTVQRVKTTAVADSGAVPFLVRKGPLGRGIHKRGIHEKVKIPQF